MFGVDLYTICDIEKGEVKEFRQATVEKVKGEDKELDSHLEILSENQ